MIDEDGAGSRVFNRKHFAAFSSDFPYSICQALHLVCRAREKEPLPTTLPPDVIPPSKRKSEAVAAKAVSPPAVTSVSK